MLERQALWLGPWLTPSQANGPGETVEHERAVCDAVTRATLGTVRQIERRSRWWPRLTHRATEVYESQDDSLLFTMVRRWALGESWLVCEAERRRIGRLCGNSI